MNGKILAAVLVIVVLASAAQGQRGGFGRGRGGGGRGRGGRGGRGPPKPSGDAYSWNRILPDGVTTTEEKAIRPTDKDVVIVRTINQAARDANVGGMVLYDFSTAVPIVAMRSKSRFNLCFLTDTTLTLADMVTQLEQRNTSATDVFVGFSTSLNGTITPLTRDEAGVVTDNNPAVGKFCRGSKLVLTVPLPPSIPGQGPAGNEEISVLTFDSLTTIVAPEASQQEGQGQGGQGGPPGRGGPGRGRGGQGRGQGGQGQGQGRGGQGQGRFGGRGGRRG